MGLRQLLLLVGWTLWVSVASFADEFTVSPRPVFPVCPPGKALIYILDELPNTKRKLVFLDAAPIGYLMGRSYLTVVQPPGTYLLWGAPAEGQWLEIDAGRTYVVGFDPEYSFAPPPATAGSRIEPSYGFHRPAGWRVGDPGVIDRRVREQELRHITMTEAGRARVEAKFSKRKYGKATKLAGAPVSLELPATFEDVMYHKKERSLVPRTLQNLNLGRVEIDETRVRFAAGGKRMEIPVDAIRSFESGPRADQRIRVRILFTRSGESDQAVFGTVTHAQHNRLVLTMLRAMHGLR